ncbi:hypothetical protein [Demequina aestuarii]|uniref:hypothetical protein n=1 Tax=Demequina aestuarii TaxID=327095 RepID=UPI000782548B|nr:hypothetical protein [Demequina aestuarii]
MVPGLILIGFVAMLLVPPRWRWFVSVTLAGGVVWLATFFFPDLADTGTLSWWQLVPAAFALGAVNTAVGATVGWLIRFAAQTLFTVVRKRRV